MGHRAYYPAYAFYEGELKPDFQMFINPLLQDQLSRRVDLQTLGNFFSDFIIPTDDAEDGQVLTFDSTSGTFGWSTPSSGSSILLQVDSVDNVDQTILNLISGSNITLTDNGDGSVTIDGASGYTDELAQDAIGSILVDTNTINFTYNDSTPSIIADVITQMSITSDSSGIKLVNDATTPLEQYHYGTAYSTGTKGWNQNFLQRDSGDNIWAPAFVTQSSKNIAGGAENSIYIGKGNAAALTTGAQNTLIGHANAPSLTTADYVTALGYNNLALLTTANDTIVIGRNNLNSYIGSLGGNIAIGRSVFNNSTTSTGLIGIGIAAGANITTATYNILIGEFAGSGITTGNDNTIIGSYSYFSTDSIRNVSIGGANGTDDAYGDTPGNRNVLIGYAVQQGGKYNNSIAIGSAAFNTASNQCSIGGSRGDEQITDFIFGGPSNRQNGNPASTGDDGVQKTFLWRIPERYNATNATDLDGHDLKIRSGLGTGSGTSGDIIFEVNQQGSTGSTVATPLEALRILNTTGDLVAPSYPKTRDDGATNQGNVLGTDDAGNVLSFHASTGDNTVYNPGLTTSIGTASITSASYIEMGNTGIAFIEFSYDASAAVGGNATIDIESPNGLVYARGLCTPLNRVPLLANTIEPQDNGSTKFQVRFGTVKSDWTGSESFHAIFFYTIT